MADAAAKYGRSLSMGLRAAMVYRTNFAFSLVTVVSPVVIQTALWTSIYGPDGTDLLFGFSYVQMIAYVVIANLVSRLVRTGFEYEVNNDIRTGSLDRFLVKPIGYFGFRLSVFLGQKALQTLVAGSLLAGAVWVLSALLGVAVTPGCVGLFVASILTAFALNFLIFWCVGMVGFWLTEIGFLFEAVRIVIITASGGIFPLSVFGRTAERVLRMLPFQYTIQFPTELLCGRLPAPQAATGFIVAGGCIVALLIIGRLLWGAGVRRFAAVGS
jgi:ABC-2 type transport system permease protein